MTLQVIMHLHNEDPFLAEIEAMPEPTHNFVKVTNPRRRDGKPIATLTDGATAVIYPWTRITFIEVLESPENAEPADALMGFFRENSRR